MKGEKGAPSVSYHSASNMYRIRCKHYARTGAAGVRREALGYKTEAQAKSEELLFAFAVRNGGARGWNNWDPEQSDAANKKRNKGFSEKFANQSSNASNPTKKSGASVLNAAQVKMLKRMRREGTATLSRLTYDAFLAQSKEDMERAINAMLLGKVDNRMSQTFTERARYVTQRLALLADMIVEEMRKAALLLRWIEMAIECL